MFLFYDSLLKSLYSAVILYNIIFGWIVINIQKYLQAIYMTSIPGLPVPYNFCLMFVNILDFI